MSLLLFIISPDSITDSYIFLNTSFGALDPDFNKLCSFKYFLINDLSKKYFFYPAQFWQHKNHDLLLNAISILKKNIPEVSLVLSGGPKYEYEKVYNLALKLGLINNIKFVGYIPDSDVRGFYCRARALVMPTFFGPTNIPPLEALVCKCPIAVSRIYGMPEQLRNSALYFNPNSVDELVYVLTSLWNDDNLCKKLVETGQEMLQIWNHEKFTNRLNNIIDSVY